MGRLSKQKAHLSDLQNAKRQQLLAQQSPDLSKNDLHAAHQEGFSDVNDDYFDEANNTVEEFIEIIQLS